MTSAATLCPFLRGLASSHISRTTNIKAPLSRAAGELTEILRMNNATACCQAARTTEDDRLPGTSRLLSQFMMAKFAVHVSDNGAKATRPKSQTVSRRFHFEIRAFREFLFPWRWQSSSRALTLQVLVMVSTCSLNSNLRTRWLRGL